MRFRKCILGLCNIRCISEYFRLTPKMKKLELFGRVMAEVMEVFRRKFPPTVRIETTNHCNACCTFCPRESIAREKAFMDEHLYRKIITECAANGCSMIHLHNFGEPLLDKQLPERITFAKKMGIKRIKIFSNGALLYGSTAEALLESGLDEIKISIDGANAREFNELRVGLDHTKVLDNTRNFKRMRDLRGRRHPNIVATCALTSDKKKSRHMVKGAVDRIVFADLQNWAGERRFFGKMNVRQPCIRLWQTFTILVNGDIALCCMDHAGKEILGNCREVDITEIWENERYKELRRLHCNLEQHKISLCNECSMSFFRPVYIGGLLNMIRRGTTPVCSRR
jgi:MoaA/NifB/PqqE/SkfB family radical SAM enzyme